MSIEGSKFSFEVPQRHKLEKIERPRMLISYSGTIAGFRRYVAEIQGIIGKKPERIK